MMIRKINPDKHTLSIQNLDVLKQFATELSKVLVPGDFIALVGDLGSGKTTFCQHLCQALGVKDKVTSPTFTLQHEYQGKPHMILHGDFYRLGEQAPDASLIELEEMIEAQSHIILMEWADNIPSLKTYWTWQITLIAPNPDSTDREVTFKTAYPQLASQIKATLS